MTPWILRSARPGDLPRLAELERESLPAPWPEADLRTLLATPSALALVAETGGAPAAGYAIFLRVHDEAELLRMGVTAGSRRQGLGRALVAAGLARLEEAGVVRVLLEVRPSNLPARLLYEGLGFRLGGCRRGYYADGEDALIYLRERAAPA